MGREHKKDSCMVSIGEKDFFDEKSFCLEASFKGKMDCASEACEKLMDSIGSSSAAGDWFEISLLLHEAVKNAVMHGCKECEQRAVWVKICCSDETVEVRVSHDGDSWDWKSEDWSLPDPEQDHGRGLFIIDHYSHEKKIIDDGRTLSLIRRLNTET